MASERKSVRKSIIKCIYLRDFFYFFFEGVDTFFSWEERDTNCSCTQQTKRAS